VALSVFALLTGGACSSETARTEKADEGAQTNTQTATANKTAVDQEGLAPDFRLVDTEGNEHSLATYRDAGKIVVLEWFNPDCPFVKKHHQSHRTMAELQNRYADRGVVWFAVNSGAPGKQGAGLERNVRAREEYGIDYPVLLDESGSVGRDFGAKTTPHMFIIDTDGRIVYQGAIDDDRGTKQLGETNFVEEALERLLSGQPIDVALSSPYGCSVKYGEARSVSM
jgi:peroxiredoxin